MKWYEATQLLVMETVEENPGMPKESGGLHKIRPCRPQLPFAGITGVYPTHSHWT